MVRLIAQMIGRNEAGRYLSAVLENLLPLVDAIVYTDDASEDGTPDLFREAGAHVYRRREQGFTVHEGRLRQAAWENLARHARLGDWILAIDCDERLFTTRPDRPLATLLEDRRQPALAVTFYHMWNATQYRTDKAWAPDIQARLFRYIDACDFVDRALACGAGPAYVQVCEATGRIRRDTGLVMQHLGYQCAEDRREKYARYLALDGGRYHRREHLASIVDPAPDLADWAALHAVRLRPGCRESPRRGAPRPPRAAR